MEKKIPLESILEGLETVEDWQRARIVADQQGYIYHQFIDGFNHGNPEEGSIFGAETLKEAKRRAHWCAWRLSCKMDNRDTMKEARYPTHGYQLFYKGNLIVDYKPPTPQEVAEGKVQLAE
jgi:hypothetical protein